jgi:hypothetical protein
MNQSKGSILKAERMLKGSGAQRMLLSRAVETTKPVDSGEDRDRNVQVGRLAHEDARR